MNPQIQALFELQKRDRQLTVLERKLTLIPKRLKELEEDMERLGQMLETERKKCDDTRNFQRTHEVALEEEEALLRNSRAKMSQVKNPRELSAIQREIESTRRMAATRTDEILKIKQAVEDAEAKLKGMSDSFTDVRTKANAEAERLKAAQTRLQGKLGKLEDGRKGLKGQVELDTIRTYERIRRRVGGVAFVAASEGRCTACKMHVPHQTFVALRKGQEIFSCESCGRLLYWKGLFPEEEADTGPKAKAAPEKRPAKAAT
ncbi:MAG: C4-type zinc ribbon domain-containing protein [Myxococcota bacterium]